MRALLVMGLALVVSLAFFIGTASADEGYTIVWGGKCGHHGDCGSCKPKCQSCEPCKPACEPACKMDTCTPVCEEPKCEPCFPQMPCEYPNACPSATGEFDRDGLSRKSA
jgi:hypothetical protein